MFQKLRAFLEAPVDAASLAFIRISFGMVMVYWSGMHLVLDKVYLNYYQPSFLFPYTGFEWVQLWPGRGLHLHFLIVMVAALGMALGVFYRICAWVFAFGITYIFLLDKATYQNHYYFISLLSLLFAICPVERVLSFDAIRRKLPATAPRWVLLIFQFQIGLVYFFGGVAKISLDWLNGFPMGQVLATKTEHPLIGSFCTEAWFVTFFVWSGMLFDLLIVPLLMWKRTRIVAFGLTLVFHLLNASLFRIGIFPWAMIFLTTILFEPDWPRRWLGTLFQPTSSESTPAKAETSILWSRAVAALMIGFVLMQLLLPMRHLLYDENTSWTERNHHFAWHMKLRGKTTAIRFYAIDEDTNQWEIFDVRGHLMLHQLLRMSRDPFMIRDFAQFIERHYQDRGIDNVSVRVFALCSLNGRTPQLLIDPKLDLTQPNLPEDWIVPLQEPMGGTFNEPLMNWEHLVMRDPIQQELRATTPLATSDPGLKDPGLNPKLSQANSK